MCSLISYRESASFDIEDIGGENSYVCDIAACVVESFIRCRILMHEFTLFQNPVQSYKTDQQKNIFFYT